MEIYLRIFFETLIIVLIVILLIITIIKLKYPDMDMEIAPDILGVIVVFILLFCVGLTSVLGISANQEKIEELHVERLNNFPNTPIYQIVLVNNDTIIGKMEEKEGFNQYFLDVLDSVKYMKRHIVSVKEVK